MFTSKIALAGFFATLAGVAQGFGEFYQCVDSEAAGVKLDFYGSWLKENNLGGKGPKNSDDPVLLYEGVGKIGAMELDLRVSVLGNEEYKTKNPGRNGYRCEGDNDATNCLTGHFGKATLKHGTETMFKFEFLKTGTDEPVVVPAIEFIVADIDMAINAGEWIGVTGYEYSVYGSMMGDPSVDFKENVMGQYDFCDRAIEAGEKCLTAHALKYGHGNGSCDNPVDPEKMTFVNCGGTMMSLVDRAFKVDFVNVSSFEVFVKMGGSGSATRSFQYALGKSTFDNFCTERVPPGDHVPEPDLACEM